MKWIENILKKYTDENGVLNFEEAFKEIKSASAEHVVDKQTYDALVTGKGVVDAKLKEFEDGQLTEEEKRQKAIDDANATIKEYARKSNKLDAEKILIEAGMTEDDYSGFIDSIVTDDAEATKNVVTSMANSFKSKLEANAEKVKSELLRGTQRPGADGGDETNGNKKTKQQMIADELVSENATSMKSSKEVLDFYTGGK